ncbi:MAG: fibronectin type III domain-containing protein [Clostridia bacterium]|nr:fibronectin type III domain-containing protein [Clostridia bacterium]
MKKLFYFIISAVVLAFCFSVTTYGVHKHDFEIEEISITDYSQTTVTLKWETVENARFYYVYKLNAQTEKYELYSAVKENEITVGNLESGKTYYFKVMPIRIRAGKRVPGEACEKLTAVTAPKGEVTIKTTDIGKKYITLTWNKIEGATGYKVFMLDEEKGEYVQYTDTAKRKLKVKKLQENTGYKFKVLPYRSENGSTAKGSESAEYTEFTYTSGIPQTYSQVAKAYNLLVNTAKNQKSMTVEYSKEIDTQVLFCSKNNLLLTVKNTANLFKGVFNRKYVFSGGKSGAVTPDSLFEPYSEKAQVERDDIDEFSCEKTKKGYKATFRLKRDSGYNVSGSYYDGALSLVDFTGLNTTPLKIRSADTYYDTATISFTVNNGKLRSLTVQGAVLADINFEVAKRVADTTVTYSIDESYKISY